MSQTNDSTAFSPRLEAHGSAGTILGSVIYLPQGLPAVDDLTSNWSVNYVYNMSFNFDISQDAGGRYNDVRNFYTQASQAEYFTITIKTNLTSIPSSWGVYVDKRSEVPVVSSTNNAQVADTINNSLLYKTVTSADTSWWVLDGSTYDFVMIFDWNERFGTRPEFTLNSIFKNAKWNGRFNVYFGLAVGSGITITHPVPIDPTSAGARFDDFAYGQFVPSWSGWDGRSGYVGRPILDMKTGLPTFAEAVVEDEYHDGVWTVPAQWDPIDPRDVREVVFPDDEGTRKDDVPA